MSEIQHAQTFQQWEQDLEKAGQDEVKGREEMDRQDAEFAAHLEDKFPILRGWGKESK